MDFFKRNWSTLILIGALAAYLGLSLGADQCPMCVVSEKLFSGFRTPASGANGVEIAGEKESLAWEARGIDGQEISSESCRGKVALLVYWATWCAPCLEEIPSLIALRREFPREQVDIIGISLDQPTKDIEPFVAARKINYDIARNNESLDRAFGPVRYIPTIIVLDPEGKARQRYTGLVGESVIRNQIKALLPNNA